MSWETVIGLEVHCQLATRTKLFCGCENRFGAEPNTLTCAVCTGQPGVLPALNEKAVALAGRAARALQAAGALYQLDHLRLEQPQLRSIAAGLHDSAVHYSNDRLGAESHALGQLGQGQVIAGVTHAPLPQFSRGL